MNLYNAFLCFDADLIRGYGAVLVRFKALTQSMEYEAYIPDSLKHVDGNTICVPCLQRCLLDVMGVW